MPKPKAYGELLDCDDSFNFDPEDDAESSLQENNVKAATDTGNSTEPLSVIQSETVDVVQLSIPTGTQDEALVKGHAEPPNPPPIRREQTPKRQRRRHSRGSSRPMRGDRSPNRTKRRTSKRREKSLPEIQFFWSRNSNTEEISCKTEHSVETLPTKNVGGSSKTQTSKEIDGGSSGGNERTVTEVDANNDSAKTKTQSAIDENRDASPRKERSRKTGSSSSARNEKTLPETELSWSRQTRKESSNNHHSPDEAVLLSDGSPRNVRRRRSSLSGDRGHRSRSRGTPTETSRKRLDKNGEDRKARRKLRDKDSKSQDENSKSRNPAHLRVYSKGGASGRTERARATRATKSTRDKANSTETQSNGETTFVWQRQPVKRAPPKPNEAVTTSERVDKLALGEVAKILEKERRREESKREAINTLRGRRAPKPSRSNDGLSVANKRTPRSDRRKKPSSASGRTEGTQFSWRREPTSRARSLSRGKRVVARTVAPASQA